MEFLTQHLTLFPPPLHISKKSRKSRLRFSQRKAARCQVDPDQGPLDDIINDITGDIWQYFAYDACLPSSSIENTNCEKADPLPLSRTPSAKPLSVRKTRSRNGNNRSTWSGSTYNDTMASSEFRDSAREKCAGKYTPNDALPFPEPNFPASGAAPACDPFTSPVEAERDALGTEYASAECQTTPALGDPTNSSKPSKSQALRKRLFSLSSGMERLRLKNSDVNRKEQSSPASPTGYIANISAPVPTPKLSPTKGRASDAASGFPHVKEDGKRPTLTSEMYHRPSEFHQDLPSISDAAFAGACTSLLTAAVRIIPEVKLLGADEEQTMWIAVEVEGVLHNRRALSDKTIDVIMLVDNAYYVTEDCLQRALDVVLGSFHNLKKNDRIALYTTHCTHETVSSIVGDTWYPLGIADAVAAEIIREMASDIHGRGTQTWKPARPNPAMAEVIIAMAKQLEGRGLREERAHVVLLSPVVHELHDVSRSFPSLHVHQVNPAVLPFQSAMKTTGSLCLDYCCRNTTINNHFHYQSASDRVRQIFKHARSEKPLGRICNVHVDLRRRPGCEVLRYEGSKHVMELRLGQVHTFFAEIRVNRSQTTMMDLDSFDPIRDAVLTADNLRQDLRNAIVLGAAKVHLLSAQLTYQNPLLPSTHWHFAETPLFCFRELGRVSIPTERAMDVYKRWFFYNVTRLPAHQALAHLDDMCMVVKPEYRDQVQKYLDVMTGELEYHDAVTEYERVDRRNLPSCSGPVPAPYEHSYLVAKWEARKKKRMGIVGA
ncbi:hypothetical protein M011DRAFT_475007 [Sporormia fimetaria CBS 119925]|uniref:Uncharacterized protein n=1 Tax=Sporormia fimetaria CBS 119925 TaxID=1340428 RepID=A0A6A6VHQ1_9PLEO|nr:hypothetical protein M011DRAFT_475007 [Sporormia fimetaria CBS 119925]